MVDGIKATFHLQDFSIVEVKVMARGGKRGIIHDFGDIFKRRN